MPREAHADTGAGSTQQLQAAREALEEALLQQYCQTPYLVGGASPKAADIVVKSSLYYLLQQSP
jgi:hypothetical protein